MSHFKAAFLFVLKSTAFSGVFICTAFILYALSPFNINTEEYNRQLAESSRVLDIQKELLSRAEANMTEQEKNTTRMSALIATLERHAKKIK